jgi:TonB family protein
MKRLVGWFILSSVLHVALVAGVKTFCTVNTASQPPIIIDFSIKNAPLIPQKEKTNTEQKRNYSRNKIPNSNYDLQPIPEISDTNVMLADTIKNIESAIPDESELTIKFTDSVASSTDEQQKNNYTSLNFDHIREQVYKGIIYPQVAIENSWDGAVMVSFFVDNKGNIDSVRILKSSGHRLLDQNAVSAIQHAAPFPKSSSKVEIRLPVIYKLEG